MVRLLYKPNSIINTLNNEILTNSNNKPKKKYNNNNKYNKQCHLLLPVNKIR